MNRRFIFLDFLLLQVFIFLYIAGYYLIESIVVTKSFIYAAMILEVLFFLYVIKEMDRLYKGEISSKEIKFQLEQADKYIVSIRAKHHDFINHLQVILGFAQMGNMKEVISYVKGLSHELIEIEKLMQLEKPEVAAIISSKIASLSYLRVNLKIKTTLKELKIVPNDIVSILGNLLDNAIFEVASKSNKYIMLEIYEDNNYFVFKISNPGVIPAEIQKNIFEPGVTTKGTQGSGLGLYNVQNIATKYNGSVSLDLAQKDRVTFTVKLPKAT